MAVDAVVWVECGNCLGDGWVYGNREVHLKKFTCAACAGLGARETAAIYCSPSSRIVPAPRRMAGATV